MSGVLHSTDPEVALCGQCAKSPLLKKLISETGSLGHCSLCYENRIPVLPTNTVLFARAFKAIVRYHFNEWEYGEDSSVSLEDLFLNDNPAFIYPSDWEALAREDFLMSFLQEIDSDSQVALSIYPTETSSGTYSSVSAGEHPLLRTIHDGLASKNYFVIEAQYRSLLSPVKEFVKASVEPSEMLYRARVGVAEVKSELNFVTQRDTFVPYRGKHIGAPPVGDTPGGRLNRPGVSFLYLASDVDTVASESRPHPGEYLSIGAFSTTRSVRIADFSKHDLCRLWASDRDLDLLCLIISIENAFATMASPSDRNIYSLTQFLADALRQMDFEGVKFRSSVGKGFNVVLFDPDVTVGLPEHESVVRVADVRYELSACPIYIPPEEDEAEAEPVDDIPF